MAINSTGKIGRFGLAAAAVAAIMTPATAGEIEFRKMLIDYDGVDVPLEYAVVLPDEFDPAAAYPTLLAFPPLEQERVAAVQAIQAYWREEAGKRGWIIVSPVAAANPADGSPVYFHMGSEVLIGPLMDRIERDFRVEGGKFHVAGPGRGAASACMVASEYPNRVASVAALSGRPHNDRVLGNMRRVAGTPITLFAGASDEDSLHRLKVASASLLQIGVENELVIEPEDSAWLLALDKGRVFDAMDKGRPKNRTGLTEDERAISQALTELHAAAARADEDAYFGLFAPDAVFFGTDPDERWTIDEFRAYALPRFEGESAWTYTAHKRTIFVAPSGDTAWFDEALSNEKYGPCRGTGVLRKIDGEWKIEQYNLSIPIRNEITEAVVEMQKAPREVVAPVRGAQE